MVAILQYSAILLSINLFIELPCFLLDNLVRCFSHGQKGLEWPTGGQFHSYNYLFPSKITVDIFVFIFLVDS